MEKNLKKPSIENSTHSNVFYESTQASKGTSIYDVKKFGQVPQIERKGKTT